MPVESLRIEPIDWHVDEFCLVWSRDGIGTPRYQSIARWKLAVETARDRGQISHCRNLTAGVIIHYRHD
jgi:hypothetical protein